MALNESVEAKTGYFFRTRTARHSRITSRQSDSAESSESVTSFKVRQFGAPEKIPRSECRQRTTTESGTRSQAADFKQILMSFDWMGTAQEYLFRARTMDDYFCEYLHALGWYRDKPTESVDELGVRLASYSIRVPKDVAEIMPPNISGFVYNKWHSLCPGGERSREGAEKGVKKVFNVRDIVSRAGLFKLNGESGTIQYLQPMTKSEAGTRLREILVKGTFIYFFAKFGHGERFAIRPSFYQRFEPVRSVLRILTSRHTIEEALNAYFEMFPIFKMQGNDLTLTVDYFSKRNMNIVRRSCKMNGKLMAAASEEMSENSDRSDPESGSEGEIAANAVEGAVDSSIPSFCKSVIDSCLVEAKHAETKSQSYISPSLPFAVRSTIRFVMDDVDEDDLLVTNPAAIDGIINRLEQRGNVSIQRQNFKKEFEEEIRNCLLLKIMSRIE